MTRDRTSASSTLRVRPVLAALAVLSSLLPAWGGSTAAARSDVALAGRTVVKGNATAGMRVRIPERVTIDVDSGVRIRGDGRIAGVVLTRPDVTVYERASFEAIRFGFCYTRGCEPQKTSHQYLYGRGPAADEHDKISLPAGTYLLYLIADDTPVRVTLRLSGLKGSRVLKPERAVDSGFALPTAANSTSTPGDDAFWWGDEFDVTGDAGYVFAILAMDVDNWLDVHYGDCAYVAGVPPPPHPLAYSPPCPGGIGAFTNESARLPESRSFEVPMFAEIGAPGHYGYGLYYTGAADVTDRFSLFFHMSLDAGSL